MANYSNELLRTYTTIWRLRRGGVDLGHDGLVVLLVDIFSPSFES